MEGRAPDKAKAKGEWEGTVCVYRAESRPVEGERETRPKRSSRAWWAAKECDCTAKGACCLFKQSIYDLIYIHKSSVGARTDWGEGAGSTQEG